MSCQTPLICRTRSWCTGSHDPGVQGHMILVYRVTHTCTCIYSLVNSRSCLGLSFWCLIFALCVPCVQAATTRWRLVTSTTVTTASYASSAGATSPPCGSAGTLGKCPRAVISRITWHVWLCTHCSWTPFSEYLQHKRTYTHTLTNPVIM